MTDLTRNFDMEALDPFQKPPEDLVRTFKTYQKRPVRLLEDDTNIIDLSRAQSSEIAEIFTQSPKLTAPNTLMPVSSNLNEEPSISFESREVPGFTIVPSMLSGDVQRWLLDRLLHRDLANEAHLTNLHKHYQIPYPLTKAMTAACNACAESKCDEHTRSFFNAAPSSDEAFLPLDTKIHKPLTISQVLNRKLRWITLGGQYDWTNKRYPESKPPLFPTDVGDLVNAFFPDMTPEAAIVNIYSPGDTLSLHRDVSEQSDNGLVSISVGCDALFMIGLGEDGNQPSRHHILRLHSGDAVYMSGAARYAWHGVPQVLASTCPAKLRSWPASESRSHSDQFKDWDGWMAGKRINLNVREMHSQYDGHHARIS